MNYRQANPPTSFDRKSRNILDMDSFFIGERAKILFVGILTAVLAACNMPSEADSSPTLNVTQAYQTVEARLTEAIALTPKSSPTETVGVTPTQREATPSPTLILETVTPAATSPPDASCNQALPGAPIDVTIPDDTKMRPNETFTKTWRLQNVGTCPWTSEYALVYFSGDQLDAPTVVALDETVNFGQSVDLSVEMTAPGTEGTYQSNWKLRDPSGTLFGIGPGFDSAFWVRIVVEGSPLITGTPTPTGTSEPTATPTAGVQVSGSATLELNNLYDLDSNQINSGDEDLAYQESDENHVLVPIGSAVFSTFGPSQPNLNDCQTANMSSNPIVIDNLVQNYICYRTNMALPGWVLIKSLDTETGFLNLDMLTWSIP
jgi:hypothetical protein